MTSRFSDTEVPVFQACANQRLTLNAGETVAMAEWSTPTTTDNSGEIPSVTCAQHLASQNERVVNCTARDTSGNTANCIFTFTVIGKDDDQYLFR